MSCVAHTSDAYPSIGPYSHPGYSTVPYAHTKPTLRWKLKNPYGQHKTEKMVSYNKSLVCLSLLLNGIINPLKPKTD